MVQRYLRGAARQEKRKQNRARGRDAHRLRDDVEDGLDEDAGGTGRRTPRRGRTKADRAEHVLGTVLAVARTTLSLRVDGRDVDAPIGGKLAGESFAVGDELDVQPRDDGPPRLVARRPRRSELARPDPGNRHRALVVAANVDVGVIVCSARSPPLRPALIDRYLVALEHGGVEPLVCVNKVDLVTDDAEQRALERTLAPYRALGVEVVFVSATRAQGLAPLTAALAGRTAVLVGHSGVGKSSLVNALAGHELTAEGSVRTHDGRGRHTTTSSTLHELSGGARLIDTPGVRAFGLSGVDADALRTSFPGFAALAPRCRFGDCTHVSEPGCAVRAAVDVGAFDDGRYAVYLRLRESLAEED